MHNVCSNTSKSKSTGCHAWTWTRVRSFVCRKNKNKKTFEVSASPHFPLCGDKNASFFLNKLLDIFFYSAKTSTKNKKKRLYIDLFLSVALDCVPCMWVQAGSPSISQTNNVLYLFFFPSSVFYSPVIVSDG